MLRALQVLQEQLAVQERLVKLARAQLFQARKDLKEYKGLQEQQDRRGRILLLLVLRALLEALVQLVLQDRQGLHLQFLGQLVKQEHKESKGFRASRV